MEDIDRDNVDGGNAGLHIFKKRGAREKNLSVDCFDDKSSTLRWVVRVERDVRCSRFQLHRAEDLRVNIQGETDREFSDLLRTG